MHTGATGLCETQVALYAEQAPVRLAVRRLPNLFETNQARLYPFLAISQAALGPSPQAVSVVRSWSFSATVSDKVCVVTFAFT